jgi:hypothetical protein
MKGALNGTAQEADTGAGYWLLRQIEVGTANGKMEAPILSGVLASQILLPNSQLRLGDQPAAPCSST